MPRERDECKSPGAAAVLSRRWFALALTLFSVMPQGALSGGLALPPLPPRQQQNMTCHDVPYPFGPRGSSLPGFEVTCGLNKEAMLRIGGNSYIIDEISLPEAVVIIFAEPIRQVCYDRKGTPRTTGFGNMSLEGTPFSFSNRNKLVATGCDHKLVANFSSSPDGPGRPAACSPYCNNATMYASCQSEIGCGEADMPMGGAQEFTFTFESTSNDVAGGKDGTCSSAFFLDKDEQTFTGGSDGAQIPLKEALLPIGERRMVLDWAIGRGNCDQASSYSLTCNDMGACVDAPSGAGYLCVCKAGYTGNAYAADGCQDVNECRSPDTNNCSIWPLFCNNTLGSYTCSCPDNMIGDGYKTGTNCTDKLAAAGSPMQQPQGSNVCSHPEKNPCVYQDYCIDGKRCACPPGMIGDGQKKGKGCQTAHTHFPLDTALGVGLALVATITIAALCYYWAMKKREMGIKRAELFRKNGGLLLQQKFSAMTSKGEDSSAKIFSADELNIATDYYSESRILGRGGQGTVYKGILPDRTVVAVKKSRVFDESQVEQFVNEITILSQTDHPNVVKLLGCCLETQVPLLVYEFIPNGTLFEHIQNRGAPRSLTWEDCLRIAEETAEALAYLHSMCSMPIIHRDIKSSNILLDENFVAKISDFGASRSVPFDQTHVTTLIQGTIGYLDPEYFQSGMLTEKSDVYSFGVVLAELLTRKKPITSGRADESCNLSMYLVTLFNEGRLLEEIAPHILAEAGLEQLNIVAHLAVRCLNLNGQERPVMKDVASVLDALRRSFAKEQTACNVQKEAVNSTALRLN